MNQTILARFEEYHRILIESLVILRFTTLKQNISSTDGRIRIRVELTGNSIQEFAEYNAVDAEDRIARRSHSFHQQDDGCQDMSLSW